MLFYDEGLPFLLPFKFKSNYWNEKFEKLLAKNETTIL